MITITANGIDFKVSVTKTNIEVLDDKHELVASMVSNTSTEQAFYTIFDSGHEIEAESAPRSVYDNMVDGDGRYAADWLCNAVF